MVVAGALLALACARPGRPAPRATAVALEPGGVVVTLVWDAAADLDLYVTDPSRETVYFANPGTASGGVLERDARCADRASGPRVERVRWTAPPPGRYRVGVDFLEPCGDGDVVEVPFHVLVDVAGRRQDVPGTARRAERVPLVVEFSVPEEPRR